MRWIMLGLLAVAGGLAYQVLDSGEGAARTAGPSVKPQPQVVAAGDSYFLALDRRGRVFGWGGAARGWSDSQLLSQSRRPRLLLDGEGYTQVSAGSQAIYALHSSGTLWRWGMGDVQDAAAANALPKPLPVGPDQRWKRLIETWGVGVGIRADGSLWYWQDDDLEEQARLQPVVLTLRAPRRLMPGTRFVDACLQGPRLHAIDDAGRLWRTLDLHGRAGGKGPFQGERTGMQALSAPARLQHVYCRGNAGQVLALDEDGRLHGYGFSSFGELGVGEPDRAGDPGDLNTGELQPIPGGPWATAAVSHSFSLAIARDGSLWGWGRNMDQELGLGDDTRSSAYEPVLADDSRRWLAVAAMYGTGLALAESGELFAWGGNGNGALGDGGVARTHDRPTAVLTDERFGAFP
ncbi:RCC1 domain-containing protein [Aerolutibacter ruishenii]|uniref:Alpha-tubulin suppressor-like RCC1 family protein n=1 Tax=Aerolutibacter ruishenii TaxID=686800 RepID=A0A562LWK6_9GAMM|nr:hypothetical protein [Lysobacter ruishenii]TWI12014.1 alpha-tubulin suppressor-like RCC1 family protein [Lysobacter ruishenii]